MTDPESNPQADAMKRDWDDRARENAKWFINLAKLDQSDEDFYATGKADVEKSVLADPCFSEGRDLGKLRLLEIGCGIGRMTRFLGDIFSEVHAVDVSAEMIAQAKRRLSQFRNVVPYETSGVDLDASPTEYFDRVFSIHVFQHVPTCEIIRSNINAALRVLKPGGLFKFQVNAHSDTEFDALRKDTWTGASFPESEIRTAARDFGAQLVSIQGQGTLDCWVILRKLAMNTKPADREPAIVYHGRTSEPLRRDIHAAGPDARVTLIVTGCDASGLDANEVRLDVDGHTVEARYAGHITQEYSTALSNSGFNAHHLAQLDFDLPPNLKAGSHLVKLRCSDGFVSQPAEVAFSESVPTPPAIYYASNCEDGGVDIHALGSKSRFRVFVHRLSRQIEQQAVGLYLDDERLEVQHLTYIPTGGYHEIVAQLPLDVHPGRHEITVIANSLRSSPTAIEIKP